MEGLKILVAGGTGFLGANLVRHFLSKGHEVHSIIRRTSSLWRVKEIAKNINFHYADLLVAHQIKPVLNRIRPNVIINSVGVAKGFSLEDQQGVMASNFETTLNLLNSCVNLDFELFINTGSAYEYGDNSRLVSEHDKTTPVDLYGIAKMAATNYSSLVARKYAKPIVTLRIFSPYGYFDSPQRLIPNAIFMSLGGHQLSVQNPLFKRDFIFVADVCQAYEAVMEKAITLEPGAVLNVGTGKCYTVKEVVQIIGNLMRKEIAVGGSSTIQGRNGIKQLCADCSEIMEKTGWKSEVALIEGLTRTIEWFRNNLDLYPAFSRF